MKWNFLRYKSLVRYNEVTVYEAPTPRMKRYKIIFFLRRAKWNGTNLEPQRKKEEIKRGEDQKLYLLFALVL